MGKPGYRPVTRKTYRCLDNIKMDLREIEWYSMDCTDLTQDEVCGRLF
jgi:hypothetical protein